MRFISIANCAAINEFGFSVPSKTELACLCGTTVSMKGLRSRQTISSLSRSLFLGHTWDLIEKYIVKKFRKLKFSVKSWILNHADLFAWYHWRNGRLTSEACQHISVHADSQHIYTRWGCLKGSAMIEGLKSSSLPNMSYIVIYDKRLPMFGMQSWHNV